MAFVGRAIMMEPFRTLTAEETTRVHSLALELAPGRAFMALICLVVLWASISVLRDERSWSWKAFGVGALGFGMLLFVVGLGWLIRKDLALFSVQEGTPVFELRGQYRTPRKNEFPKIGGQNVEFALPDGVQAPTDGADVVGETIRFNSRYLVVAIRPSVDVR